MVNHWQKVDKNLSSRFDSYNQELSSLESIVLVSVRKFKDLNLSNQKKSLC